MEIIKRNGLQANPLAGIADPNAVEAVCSLCGGFGAVNRDGYCGTDECSLSALEYARHHPELKALVNLGSIRVLLLKRLERHSDPVMPEMYVPKKDTGLCEISECTQIARPRDLLCNQCRRENPKHRKRLPKGSGLHNRIRGLEGIRVGK